MSNSAPVRRVASARNFLGLLRRVALADDEEVDLLRRRSVLEDDRRGPVRRGGRAVDEATGGVDRARVELAERPVRSALLQHELDRRTRLRETLGLVEDAPRPARLAGRLPLAVDAREAAGVEQAVRRRVDDGEEVLPQVGLVDEPGPAARPGALQAEAVRSDVLLVRVSGVVIVEAQGAPREALLEARVGGEARAPGRQAAGGDEGDEEGELRSEGERRGDHGAASLAYPGRVRERASYPRRRDPGQFRPQRREKLSASAWPRARSLPGGMGAPRTTSPAAPDSRSPDTLGMGVDWRSGVPRTRSSRPTFA